MPSAIDTERIWKRNARRTAWAANCFWWLQRFLPFFLGLNLASAVAVIYARQQEWPQDRIVAIYAAVLVVLALIALGLAWRRFLSQRDGMLRLEQHLGLKSALSAASEGAIAWPPLPEQLSVPYQFRWGNITTPIAVSATLLLIGCLIPVETVRADVVIDNPKQPMAWEELEAWVEELTEDEVVEETALKELEKKLDELRQQPTETWFTQSSLEAGDSLRDQTQQDLQKLAQDMMKTSALLDAMRQAGDEPFSQEAMALEGALQKALEGMQLGTTPLSSEMMEQLKKMGNSQSCQNIDLSKYKLVKGTLDENAQKLCKLAKLNPDALEDMILMACQMPGNGGIDRGPGAAPLTASPFESRVTPASVEGVSNEDMRNAALGQTLAIQDRAPDENEAGEAFIIKTSQGSDSLGQGGDVVWKNQLSPEERKLLENYFQ
ncbi:hypothetical protein [Cerasicoccus arenae]|uniref:Uncharacterized protein n=1 Tax=Cerasicoccus arenae TaxID=424488 RepID=A0A8J3GCY5_9BACT|nr:hypothetical protein [Cerasicoccus arenae]MBK1859584.1 hypothetical protein [Cerasicoccus arenae]GHB92868.1 hypothetical protein GCM10007047_05230 [Cerasicoccus arenae]